MIMLLLLILLGLLLVIQMAGTIIIVVRIELLRVIIVRMLKRWTDDQAIGGVADSSCSNNWSNKSTTSHIGRWLWLLFCLLLLLLVLLLLVLVRLPNGRAWDHRHLVVRSESTYCHELNDETTTTTSALSQVCVSYTHKAIQISQFGDGLYEFLHCASNSNAFPSRKKVETERGMRNFG